MKKRCVLTTLLLIVVLLASCGGNSAPAAAEAAPAAAAAPVETFNWKMVSCWSPQYHLGDQDREFMVRLDALVGDQMKVDYFVENALVGPKEVFDAVKDDVAQFGSDYPGYWAGKDTAFNLLSS